MLPIFRQCKNIVHMMSWMSRLARREARSTTTAELLVAGDLVERLACFKSILEKALDTQTTEPVLNWQSAFHRYSTTKEPEEDKNKLIFLTIRETFHTNSATMSQYSPGWKHLAGGLTKINQDITKLLNISLTYVQHNYHHLSLIATQPIPLAQQTVQFNKMTGSKRTTGKSLIIRHRIRSPSPRSLLPRL